MRVHWSGSVCGVAAVFAFGLLVSTPVAGQSRLAESRPFRASRTSDGQPDLQGGWDFRTITPLERPSALEGKELLTVEEAAIQEQLTAEERIDRVLSLPPEERNEELDKQIDLHLSNSKQSENNKEFIFVEVGSYLGESLELWGDLLEKKLKNNFLIISIDPFTNYVSDVDAKSQENKYAYNIRTISQNMEKAYMYFINNISLKDWKNKHIHFRMNSYYGFKTI